MKIFLKFLLFVSLSFVLVLNTFAIDAPINIEIKSYTDTSVVVAWEPVEDALMYYVYYGKESGKISDYENYSDFVEGNSIEINDLDAGTNYYFAVTSLDKNGEESIFSEEIEYYYNNKIITESNPEDIEFIFKGVSVISYNKLKLYFTNPLDNSENAIREFKITNKADSFDTFEVVSSELSIDDNLIIELVLDRDLDIGSEYEVVIVAITSTDGKNIESGIDNMEEFIVTEINDKIDLNSAGIEETISTGKTVSIEKLGLAGTNIDSSEVENTTLSAAAIQEKLPETGLQHILLIILSIIMGALVFVFKFKKA